jgi:predicted CXXCH cytochrome family protein
MIRLQSFSHRASGYERPNEPWICGWAATGQPCRVGPDRRGRCQATFECQPQRKQDRWECTRPATAGGRCTEGPRADGTCCHPIPPCVPVRSQRSRRGQIAALSFALLLGALALCLGGRSVAWLVEPGRLTVQHAGIPQCGTCHTSFAAGPVGWLHAAFADLPAHAEAQPCLACHDIGAHPLSAHALDIATLQKLGQALVSAAPPNTGTDPPKAASVALASFALPGVARGEIPCSACHREHRGAAAALTSVTKGICQTCHAVRFASLANGHPDFRNYPFHRRLRIAFDHAKHFAQYFGQAKKALVPAGCTGCHAIGTAGVAMVVKPFAVTCGGCHSDEIKGKEAVGDKGIAVFGVPALDLPTLRAHEAAIGGWPTDADGDMTPFLRFLISRRPETATDLATLGTASLADLSHASDAQIAAAARIAWAIKGLLFDLSIKGPAVLAQAAGGGERAASEAAALVGGLPPDAIKTAEKLWFPDLADEVARHRAGERVPMKTPKPAPNASAAPQPTAAAGGPQGAIAGTGTGSILGGGAGILGGAASSPPPKESHGSILGGGILGGAAATPAPASPPAAGGQGAIAGTGTGSILGGGAGILGGAASTPPPKEGHGSILGGGGILGGAAATPAVAATPLAPPKPPAPQPMDSEAWTGLGGGWYRLDYNLYYRPEGHADPFMHAWLDVTGREAGDAKGSARLLFNRLADPGAPGVCGKCHSVDRGPGGVRLVNWVPFRFDREQHGFTKFAHRPHLSLFGGSCKSCHQIEAAPNFAASYKSADPFVFAASFKPIKRELCASCHVAGRVADTCETCHNYHIGHVPQAPGVTTRPLPAMPTALEHPAGPAASLRRAGRAQLAERLSP